MFLKVAFIVENLYIYEIYISYFHEKKKKKMMSSGIYEAKPNLDMITGWGVESSFFQFLTGLLPKTPKGRSVEDAV